MLKEIATAGVSMAPWSGGGLVAVENIIEKRVSNSGRIVADGVDLVKKSKNGRWAPDSALELWYNIFTFN